MVKKFFGKRSKIVSVLLTIIWIAGVLHLVKSHPTDTHEKFTRMQADIDNLLKVGGTVIDRSENFKYGSAYVLLVMSETGWSQELMSKFDVELKERQWVKHPVLDAYCLDGMQIVVRRHTGMHNGVGTNFVGATYDASTIKQCSEASREN